ncbi:MAG: PKD domain-containing protein [bacterium]|nr:PKD domain-containing protein [bacterium]
MGKSQKKKIWILLVLTLIGMGLFVYFIFWQPHSKITEEKPRAELSAEDRADKISPSTAVVSPKNQSWHNQDFETLIYDSDLGSGLDECKYIIEDLGNGQAIGDFRECGESKINVPVGEGKVCSTLYCKVSAIAFDRAGNSSGWRSRIFNIDLINPEVSQIFFQLGPFEPNKNYSFQASVSDNAKIIGCWFYLGKESLPAGISPIPCEDGKQCLISAEYNFKKEGEYSVRFGCQDAAENAGFGEPETIKVIVNHPPSISFCRVLPAQGTVQTAFQFQVKATDPDGDSLAYNWDFGSGEHSSEQSPSHSYLLPGTYEPKIVVVDEQGLEAKCSTAWAVVNDK